MQQEQSKMWTKLTESCTRRFLRQLPKYGQEKKGESRNKNQLMIVAEYANTFLTLTFNKYETGESVYSYHRIRRLQPMAPPY